MVIIHYMKTTTNYDRYTPYTCVCINFSLMGLEVIYIAFLLCVLSTIKKIQVFSSVLTDGITPSAPGGQK